MTQQLTPAGVPDAGTTGAWQRPPATLLPRWPVAFLFVWFPLWWALGFVDFVWIPVALLMAVQLARSSNVRVPRGFGIWLVFLVWSAASVVMIGGALDLVGFTYRFLLYVAGTVLMVYVYNARARVTARYVSGCLTVWWITTVVGGYLGLMFPSAVIKTPLSYVLPGALLRNDLVNHMVIRRLTQYNPESFLQVAPRPSAPFLYTNNWGNVFSLLLPFVVAYLFHCRGERRFPWLLAMLPISAVPALLTLNRGMFLGIGIAMVYGAVRLALMRRYAAVVSLGVVALMGVVLFQLLPVEERLGNRLTGAESTSNDTRASLYLQSIELLPQSPIFGFGAPVEGNNPDAAPVGTQGQVWMLLVSHGPVATFAFLAWFLLAFARTLRRTDPVGLASGTVLLVGTIELGYYGILPNGLPIMMVAAALGLRGPDPAADDEAPEPEPTAEPVEAPAVGGFGLSPSPHHRIGYARRSDSTSPGESGQG